MPARLQRNTKIIYSSMYVRMRVYAQEDARTHAYVRIEHSDRSVYRTTKSVTARYIGAASATSNWATNSRTGFQFRFRSL